MLPLARLSLPIKAIVTSGAPGALVPMHAERECGDGPCRPHIALAELDVCLQCASGLNTSCGFFNCALTFSRDDENAAESWHWKMFTCSCEACEQATAASSTVVGASADRRSALLDRHRVQKLDAALSVNEMPEDVARRVPNSVPVLQLRAWIVCDERRVDRFPLVDAHAVPLLRRLLAPSARIGVAGLFDYVFCAFDRTMEWLSSAAGRDAWVRIVAERADALAVRHQIFCSPEVMMAPEKHQIACALQLRVAVAYELIAACTTDLRLDYADDEDTQSVVLALQLFADTHADLSVFCEAVCTWSDVYLSQPTISTFVETEFGAALRTGEAERARREAANQLLPECALLSPFERYYPHPLRCAFGGELPSITGLLSQVSVWTRIKTTAGGRVADIVHSLVAKVGNYKCQTREAVEMICAALGRQPALVQLVLDLLQVSQLGNYEGALQRPLWRARCAIRRTFHWDKHEQESWCARCAAKARVACPLCDDDNPAVRPVAHKSHLCGLCAFIHANRRVAVFSVREFYINTLVSSGVMDSMLRQTTGWIEHRRITEQALNDTRTLISRTFDARGTGGADLRDRMLRAQRAIERQLMLLHDCNKPTMRRLFKTLYLHELIGARAVSVFTERFVSDKWSGRQNPLDFLMAPLADDLRGAMIDPDTLMETPPRDVHPLHFVCEVELEHLGGKRWCDLFERRDVVAAAQFCESQCEDFQPLLLASIGASPAAVEMLNKACYESSERGMPNNQFVGLCEKLADDMPVDFMLLVAFLSEMRLAASVKVRHLDDDTALAQARALRRRLSLETWEPLPYGCDRLWFCREHAHVYCDVSDPLVTPEGTVPAFGPVGAMFSHTLGGPVCRRGGRSTGAQKWRNLGLLDVPIVAENEADESRISSIRTKRRVLSCDSRLLDSRSLLGAVVTVGATMYTLCVRCGAVCRWTDAHLRNDGMTCGRENEAPADDTFKELREYVSSHTQQVRECVPVTESGRASRTGDVVGDMRLLPLVDQIAVPRAPSGEHGDILERLPVVVFCHERERLINSSTYAPDQRSQVPTSSRALLAVLDRMGSRKSAQAAPKQPTSARERALARPNTHTQEEWDMLDDEGRFFRNMPAGVRYWRIVMALRNSTAPDAIEELHKVAAEEATRCAKLREDGHFQRAERRFALVDRIEAEEGRRNRRFAVSALSTGALVNLRSTLTDAGLVRPRLDIICAFCNVRCERRSKFTRCTVQNCAATLVDSHDGLPIEELGLVELWLCVRCDTFARPLLARESVPTASRLFNHLVRMRSDATKRKMRPTHNRSSLVVAT